MDIPDMELRATGVVAYTTQASPRNVSVWIARPGGNPERLDRGAIDAQSLRRAGERLTWAANGRTRSAPFR